MSKSTNMPEHKLRLRDDIASNERYAGRKLPPSTAREKGDLRTTSSARQTGVSGSRADHPAGERSAPAARAWPFSTEDATSLAWWRTLPSDLLRDAEGLLVCATLNR